LVLVGGVAVELLAGVELGTMLLKIVLTRVLGKVGVLVGDTKGTEEWPVPTRVMVLVVGVVRGTIVAKVEMVKEAQDAQDAVPVAVSEPEEAVPVRVPDALKEILPEAEATELGFSIPN
jgi:hypothetical protein